MSRKTNFRLSKILDQLKIIDRITNVLNKPSIRKIRTFITDPKYDKAYTTIINDLRLLGYELAEFGRFDCIFLTVENGASISARSENYKIYKKAEDVISDIPIDELLSMSDEELELYIRMN